MLVRDLIAKLQKLPGDMEVLTYSCSWDGDYKPVDSPRITPVAHDGGHIHDCTFDKRPNQFQAAVL